MTATLDRADQDRPLVADATVGAPALAVVDLPDDFDPLREYVIPGCATLPDEKPFEAMVGPLTARPDRSLADVVREVAG